MPPGSGHFDEKHVLIQAIECFAKDLRLLAADGAFVPVPACAEVLLFSAHDLLQRAHIGSGGKGVEVAGDE